MNRRWVNNFRQLEYLFMSVDNKSDAGYGTLNINIINLINSFTREGRVEELITLKRNCTSYSCRLLVKDCFYSRWWSWSRENCLITLVLNFQVDIKLYYSTERQIFVLNSPITNYKSYQLTYPLQWEEKNNERFKER